MKRCPDPRTYLEERRPRLNPREPLIFEKGRDGFVESVHTGPPCECCEYYFLQRDGELTGEWILLSENAHPPLRHPPMTGEGRRALGYPERKED